LYDFFILYKKRLLDDATIGIVMDLYDMFWEIPPERCKPAKGTERSFFDMIYEVFPIPFCA
jgi:hypothetical protein